MLSSHLREVTFENSLKSEKQSKDEVAKPYMHVEVYKRIPMKIGAFIRKLPCA